MALKNLLVAYNNSESAQKALDVALVMQAKFDTHITGLVAREHPHLGSQMDGWLPDTIKKAILEQEKEACDAVEAAWIRAVEDRCVQDRTHWIQTGGNPDATVMTYARYFDMTVMGQAGKPEEGLPMVSHPDLIALQSGRPVMTVPRDFDRGPISEKVVLAWDGRRAAARAMADAIHFLEKVSLVTILSIGDTNPNEEGIQVDVATHLSRHGIDTEHVKIESQRRGHEAIARAIVDYCEKNRPDALVMGAYEHSKFREDYFGGVTNTVFKDATIPVFLSHYKVRFRII
jgi:nucleotide-binding universal stress UspA family protein